VREDVGGKADGQVVQPEFLEAESLLRDSCQGLTHLSAGDETDYNVLAQQNDGTIDLRNLRLESVVDGVRLAQNGGTGERIDLDYFYPVLQVAARISCQLADFLVDLRDRRQGRHGFDIVDEYDCGSAVVPVPHHHHRRWPLGRPRRDGGT